jgi:hypothetical protein
VSIIFLFFCVSLRRAFRRFYPSLHLLHFFRRYWILIGYHCVVCSGQLCTDLEEIIQEQYHHQLFNVLIPTLEDPEARCVHLSLFSSPLSSSC